MQQCKKQENRVLTVLSVMFSAALCWDLYVVQPHNVKFLLFVGMKVHCLTSLRAVCGISTKWLFMKLLLQSSICQTAQQGSWHLLFQVGSRVLFTTFLADRKGGKTHWRYKYSLTEALESKYKCSDCPQVQGLLDGK